MLALVLIIMLLILQVAESIAYSKTANACEILAKISNDLPVEYDHVIVKGCLSRCGIAISCAAVPEIGPEGKREKSTIGGEIEDTQSDYVTTISSIRIIQ